MLQKIILLWVSVCLSSIETGKAAESLGMDEWDIFYAVLESNHDDVPAHDFFRKGLTGFLQLKEKGVVKEDILTLIDFRLSSNIRRLWVIDMKANTILHHTWVAHGRNSGEEYAMKFSNRPHANTSSLGFYITGETYQGKHGLSMYLDGMEPGFNDKARTRAIVMHGADYANTDFIEKYGRLGRSLGCPAIPTDIHQSLIQTIKGGSCLFIYYPDPHYEEHSTLLKERPIQTEG